MSSHHQSNKKRDMNRLQLSLVLGGSFFPVFFIDPRLQVSRDLADRLSPEVRCESSNRAEWSFFSPKFFRCDRVFEVDRKWKRLKGSQAMVCMRGSGVSTVRLCCALKFTLHWIRFQVKQKPCALSPNNNNPFCGVVMRSPFIFKKVF